MGFPGVVIPGFLASSISFLDLKSSLKVEKIRSARILTTQKTILYDAAERGLMRGTLKCILPLASAFVDSLVYITRPDICVLATYRLTFMWVANLLFSDRASK